MYPKQNNLDLSRRFLFSSVFARLSTGFLLIQIFLAILNVPGQRLAGQIDIIPKALALEDKTSLYVNSFQGFSVRYPVGWEKIEFAPGISEGTRSPIVNFLSPPRVASDLFREFLIIESVNLTSNHPSVDSVATGEIQYLKQSFPGFSLVQSTMNKTTTSYPAHELEYTYSDPIVGKDKAMEVWILGKAKVYVLSYHAAATEFSSYLPTAQMIIDSFTITRW